MADRAQYLARTLIARIANLEEIAAEDGRAEPDRSQRIQAIEKVLAVELGITESATMAVVEAAVPHRTMANQARDQEVATLADFLRRRLARELAES